MKEFTRQEIALLSLIDFGIEEYDMIDDDLKEKLYNFFEVEMTYSVKKCRDRDLDIWILAHLAEIPGVGR